MDADWKMEVMAEQLELDPDLVFKEVEALTETLYVVEPAEEDVIEVKRRKQKGEQKANLKDLSM